MTRNQLLAVGVGIGAVGGYLAVAYSKCWFPFSQTARCKGAVPPGGEVTPPGAPPPPGQPTVSYQVTGSDTAVLNISWNPVQGATYYQVLINGNLAADQVRETTTTVNVKPSATYQVQIVACA